MKINQQPAEKRAKDRFTLDVHSIFSTIQGEGPFCGRPAIFIRLAGCNLQCPGCDTDYTSIRNKLSIKEIIQKVKELLKETETRLIVITGGEPFRQDISYLVGILLSCNKEKILHIQIETNGTMPVPDNLINKLSYKWITIVCSPKTAKLNPSAAKVINHYKYVLSADSVNEKDGLPLQALGHRATPFIARPPRSFGNNIYLQPMDEGDEEKNLRNRASVLESCKKHGYILQLQIHKILGVE